MEAAWRPPSTPRRFVATFFGRLFFLEDHAFLRRLLANGAGDCRAETGVLVRFLHLLSDKFFPRSGERAEFFLQRIALGGFLRDESLALICAELAQVLGQ